jgi:hypothetical protein
MLDRGAVWEKAELFRALHWMRQLIGVVLGVCAGVIGVTGYVGNLAFFGIAAGVSWAYYAKFLQVDQEELGSWELISEGMWPAFAMFLLAWISTYTLIYN